MNRDVRGGLVLLCLAGILGILYFAGRPAKDTYFAEVTTANQIAENLGAPAALFVIAGLFLVVKGLLADRP